MDARTDERTLDRHTTMKIAHWPLAIGANNNWKLEPVFNNEKKVNVLRNENNNEQG